MADNAKAILYGLVGGLVGFFVFKFLLTQNIHVGMLPGAAVGFAAGFVQHSRSNQIGIACAIIALAIGFFAEWNTAPFIADGSFSYFVTHLHQIRGVSLVMILLGAAVAFWNGRGR